VQALIQFIIDRFFWLWPIVRVNEWQAGMMVRCGRIHRELKGGGLYWRWWGFESLYTWPATENSLDLASGGVTTRDGHAVSLSANISYRLVSLRAFYLRFWNSETTLQRVAIGMLCTAAAREDWSSLLANRADFETAQLRQFQALAAAEAWGVEIVRFNLTDMVPAPAHRHYIDGSLPTRAI